MPSPTTLKAFEPEEEERVQRLLALKVAHMMGRKMEEGDWAEVYCAAKGIPNHGWSNLNIDVVHDGLGVEHKMLCFGPTPTLTDACTKTLMHPSATRSFRIESLDADPNDVMRDVLRQYADLLAQRRRHVEDENRTENPTDMRTGWLLWQTSLRQFLYFEEPTTAADPDAFYAEWHERRGGGTRKSSKNLWVFDRDSGQKRYSITTSAGGKIQPYFDVPSIEDPNLYLFTVMGQRDDARVRVWITRRTADALFRTLRTDDPTEISSAIRETVAAIAAEPVGPEATEQDDVVDILIDEQAYEELTAALPGINDEHSFQLLVDYLASH